MAEFSFGLLSLNVRGFRNNLKRKKMLDWLKRKSNEIILLQETYCTKDMEERVSKQWNGKIYYSHGSSHSKGVCIMIKNNFDFKLKRR